MGVPVGPKLKQRSFDSAVALFTEWLFYSESLLVSALIKITILVQIPSRPWRWELPIDAVCKLFEDSNSSSLRSK